MTEQQSTIDTPEDTSEVTPEPGSNREARYRRELRAAEAERDQLRDRITTMLRSEAERLAADHLLKPAALWAVEGTELDNLLDEDGNLDPEKVSEAARAAAEHLGAAAPPVQPKPDPTQGGMGGRPATDPWQEAFAPRR